MKTEELAKLLLDSSFKEADLFWKRNAAMLVVQAILLGVLTNLLTKTPSTVPDLVVYLLIGVGIVVAAFHRVVLEASDHYNGTWAQAFQDWVNAQASSETGERPADRPWTHLKETFHNMETLSSLVSPSESFRRGKLFKLLPLHATTATKWIANILLLFWISLFVVVVVSG